MHYVQHFHKTHYRLLALNFITNLHCLSNRRKPADRNTEYWMGTCNFGELFCSMWHLKRLTFLYYETRNTADFEHAHRVHILISQRLHILEVTSVVMPINTAHTHTAINILQQRPVSRTEILTKYQQRNEGLCWQKHGKWVGERR